MRYYLCYSPCSEISQNETDSPQTPIQRGLKKINENCNVHVCAFWKKIYILYNMIQYETCCLDVVLAILRVVWNLNLILSLFARWYLIFLLIQSLILTDSMAFEILKFSRRVKTGYNPWEKKPRAFYCDAVTRTSAKVPFVSWRCTFVSRQCLPACSEDTRDAVIRRAHWLPCIGKNKLRLFVRCSDQSHSSIARKLTRIDRAGPNNQPRSPVRPTTYQDHPSTPPRPPRRSNWPASPRPIQSLTRIINGRPVDRKRNNRDSDGS